MQSRHLAQRARSVELFDQLRHNRNGDGSAASLTITPTSQTKHYGETLSLTAFTTSGLQNRER